jgi:membrane protein DedA with SNARE-associated domain
MIYNESWMGGTVMEQLLDVIVNYIGAWGYPAIFLGMALESACLPVPSEVIFGFAGYLVFLGRLGDNSHEAKLVWR